MRNILLFIGFLWCLPGMAADSLKGHVDECFELTSIVFRLAGASEYSKSDIPYYANDIDAYFAPYKKHKLIDFAKEIRNKYGVSYNAIASAAASLKIDKGKIILNSDIDISKVKEIIDYRWTPETFKTFLSYLNDFYKKSKFKDFYSKHADLYRIAEQRLDERLTLIDVGWFESTFGKKLDNLIVVASLTNGSSNYAFSIPGKKGIVIGSASDGEGMPFFSKNKTLTILHEFLHHYTNPLIYNYWGQIDSAAQTIYPHVEDAMKKNAYKSAKTMMVEWFDNLLVILYNLEHPIVADLNILIRNDQNKGFIWMERSIDFMPHFLENRDKYPTLDSFMPQVVNFVNYTADNFDQVLDEFNHRQPYIVDAFPLPGSTVSADVDTIKIRFSEPMISSHGLMSINNENISMPPRAGMPLWKNQYTYVIPVIYEDLQKGKTYGFKLPKDYFQSIKRYSLKEDYVYTIKMSE